MTDVKSWSANISVGERVQFKAKDGTMHFGKVSRVVANWGNLGGLYVVAWDNDSIKTTTGVDDYFSGFQLRQHTETPIKVGDRVVMCLDGGCMISGKVIVSYGDSSKIKWNSKQGIRNTAQSLNAVWSNSRLMRSKKITITMSSENDNTEYLQEFNAWCGRRALCSAHDHAIGVTTALRQIP